MLLSKYILAVFSAILLYVIGTITREDCASYGYNVAVLSCETCEQMNKILDHTTTYDNCRACCIEKVEEKYAVAVLEVDKRYLSFMKEISAVIEKKQELKLKVRYRTGNPTLFMYKEKGDKEPAESIAVGSWEKGTFEDYLATHLKSSTEPAAKAKSSKKK
jgi:hypothetical protein